MATVECHMAVPPGNVFRVLADGWTYSNWVVGTSHVRAVDSGWPAVGARLHHASGIWPLSLRDESVVVDVVPDQSLSLMVRIRPVGEVSVVIDLVPEGEGTHVTMREEPVSGPGRWLHNPISDALLMRRNVATLGRLAAMAERHSQPAA